MCGGGDDGAYDCENMGVAWHGQYFSVLRSSWMCEDAMTGVIPESSQHLQFPCCREPSAEDAGRLTE